jgi:4-amino-4-deoxy-L-arabinose transferase-like glycosyltransferase
MLWAAAGLAVLTLLRLVLAAQLPLAPDEAYYWVWSRDLQAGYFDHPPMVAFFIRAGCALAGQTPLGVRMLGPLCGALGSVLIWQAGEDFFPGKGAGVAAALLLNTTVLVGVGAIVMTPDTPLFLFWIAGLAALGRLLRTGDARWWLAAGAAAGAMLLSKYTGVLFLVSVAAWLISRPEGRAMLRRVWPWAGAALAALIFAPNVLWNAGHDWVSYAKQGGRVAGLISPRAPQFLGELVAGQIGLMTPLIFGLAVAGVVVLARRREASGQLLFWLTLLPMVVFLEHALSGRVESNWPAVIYPSACLAAAGVFAGRRWVGAAAGFGLALSGAVYAQGAAALFPLPARADPAALQLAGWPEFAAAVGAGRAAFYTSDEYGPAAELAFLLPSGDAVAGLPDDRRWGFFTLPPANLAGQQGVLVTRRRDTPCPHDLGRVTRDRGRDVIATYRLCGVTAPSGGVLLPHP